MERETPAAGQAAVAGRPPEARATCGQVTTVSVPLRSCAGPVPGGGYSGGRRRPGRDTPSAVPRCLPAWEDPAGLRWDRAGMNTEQVSRAPESTPRRQAGTAVLALTAVTMAAIIVQFALAGLGTFGEVHGKQVKDADFAAHQTLGMVIGLLTLLVLIAALVARRSRRSVILAIVLFVLAGPVQPVLGTLGADDAAWVGMLHAVNGVAIMAMNGMLLAETRALRTRLAAT